MTNIIFKTLSVFFLLPAFVFAKSGAAPLLKPEEVPKIENFSKSISCYRDNLYKTAVKTKVSVAGVRADYFSLSLYSSYEQINVPLVRKDLVESAITMMEGLSKAISAEQKEAAVQQGLQDCERLVRQRNKPDMIYVESPYANYSKADEQAPALDRVISSTMNEKTRGLLHSLLTKSFDCEGASAKVIAALGGSVTGGLGFYACSGHGGLRWVSVVPQVHAGLGVGGAVLVGVNSFTIQNGWDFIPTGRADKIGGAGIVAAGLVEGNRSGATGVSIGIGGGAFWSLDGGQAAIKILPLGDHTLALKQAYF